MPLAATSIGIALAIAASVLPARAESDRARVIAALEQLITTGRPAHAQHDDGQLLQRDLDALLARGDPELLQLARRAAAPIVSFVSHPIARRTGLPYVGIETRRVLQAPDPENYSAVVVVSIDGASWTRFCDVKPESPCGRNVQALPASASTPGFHLLRFQALVRHQNGDVETRPLQAVAYGIMGVRRGTPGREDPALFLRAAAAARAPSFDASLPDMTLTDWLRSLHGAGASIEAALWESQWCGLGTRAELRELEGQSICATAMLQVAETKLVAEVRIRVGNLEWDGGLPRWIAETPTLDSILIRRERATWLSSLTQLPEAFRSPADTWPAARVSVHPADIAYAPLASNPGAAGSFVVRATVRNLGEADTFGVAVDLMAVTRDGPILRRRRVIDVPAGGSVTLTERVSYPAAYGAFVVILRHTGDGGPFSDTIDDDAPWPPTAFRIINPEAAPHGFDKWVAEMLCANQCRGY